jgi:signal transduction histidine kinase
MNFSFNNYALTLLTLGVITIILGISTYRRGSSLMRRLGLVMGSTSIWAIAHAFELASSDLNTILLLNNIQYIGIVSVPINWLSFCLAFSNRQQWLESRLHFTLLTIIPLTSLILVWTNPSHHLYYKNVVMFYDGPSPMSKITPNIFYYVFVTYFYCILTACCYLIVTKFKHSNSVYRRLNAMMVFAASIPLLANLSYILKLRPAGYIDITPFAFSLTSMIILFSIYRFKLFDIIPIAREKVVDLLNDGFLVVDEKFRVIDNNNALSNYVRKEDFDKIFGISIEKLFEGDNRLINAIKEGENRRIEYVGTIDGNIKTYQADILHFHGGGLNNNITIVKLQDLTTAKQDALKAREQSLELEKLNQQKNRVFSIIAHDLRGPLVNLSEVLKMVSNSQITDEEFKHLAPILSKDITYTTDLLENLLHWSRSELAGFGLKQEFLNIRTAIVNEINYLTPSAKLKGVAIINDVFPNQIAYADTLMFQIVVRNILSNAIKFCNDGCKILIMSSFQRGGFLKIEIIDDGSGMSEDYLKKVFTSEIVSGRGTNNERGTGLGLMICKEFMKRNKGEIFIESELGKGTKLTLFLPTNEHATIS